MKKKHSFLKKRNKLRLMSLFFLLLSSLLGFAQTPQRTLVKGIVVDESGNPIIGATIVGDIATGTITNLDGDFQINLPTSVKLLTISYIGYVEQKIPINNRTYIKIVLKEDVKSLSEVVVVGYGAQKKETLTGSISSVQTKALVQSPTANISNALVGRIPGIVSNQASGEAGFDATTIRIRGVATLNESGREPLIVIDGVQSSMAAMNALDSHEIESVSVLKDASSTAVYGVKGANGVVIVTTKRGQQGKPSINFSYRLGTTKPISLLKMLNSYDYALYRNEAILSDKDAGKYSYLFTDDELWKFKYNRDYTPEEVEMLDLTDEQKQQLLNSPALYYSSHDYIAEQFDNIVPQQQYNLNVSGGSEKVKYFFSVGNFSQKGNFNTDYRGYSANSSYDRYNLRSNLDINVHKNLKLSVDFGGQFAAQTGIVGSDNDGGTTNEYARHKAMMVNILTNTPFVGPGIINNNLVTSYVSSKSPLQSKGGYGYSGIAALFNARLLTNNTSRMNTNIRLNHLMDYLTRGLSVSGSISYNDVYRKGVITANNVPTYSVYRNPNNPNELIFAGGSESPRTVTDNQNNYKWNQFYLESKIDYNRKFGKHNITGMLVMNAQKTYDPSLEYKLPAGLIGTAFRATYNYNDKYLAEFNAGYNGSENFPENKRFGFFPAISLGWIVTNEKFIHENNFLTWLKIRGSYGEVGNDKVGGKRYLYTPNAWAYLPQASGNGYSFGTTDGSSTDPYYAGGYEYYVGNPDVTWERAHKANIGADINFFKNRLQFVGDLFYEKRDNILWKLGTVPGIVATDLPPANIGEVTNKGYEIQLKWGDKIFHDLYYNIGINVSYAINRIDFKDEPTYLYEWMNETGFSLGQYKGYKTSGFYNSEEEASNRPYVSVDGNKVQAGDFRYVDIDGDGKIDANDQIPIGYSNLPRYSFSGNFDLEYKGFSLSLLFTGSYKGSIPMTSFYILNPFYMNNGAAFYFQYDNHWTPEKAALGIEGTFPRASLRTYDSQNGAMNDMWIRSTQFLRLKNAEIGYSIKKLGALKKIGISNIRIYLSGNNLLTWGSQLPSGFDPEQEDSGGASLGYLYPPTRTVNFGVSVQY